MSAESRKGDRVSWNTPQGRTCGKVVGKKALDFTLVKSLGVDAPIAVKRPVAG